MSTTGRSFPIQPLHRRRHLAEQSPQHAAMPPQAAPGGFHVPDGLLNQAHVAVGLASVALRDGVGR